MLHGSMQFRSRSPQLLGVNGLLHNSTPEARAISAMGRTGPNVFSTIKSSFCQPMVSSISRRMRISSRNPI